MIQNYKDEYDALAQMIYDNWTDDDGQPLTDIYWTQIPGEPKMDEDGEVIPYMFFKVENMSAEQKSIGAFGDNVVRHYGSVHARIFVKPSQGEMFARELADKLCTIYRNNITIEGVTFGQPMYSVVGTVADGMFLVLCSCPFTRDSYL